jgi:hypothetical protein
MTAENKKIAMYFGGAVLVGAVGFFVYSFFQKPILVGNTSIDLGNPKQEDNASTNAPIVATTPTNPFSQLLAQQQANTTTPFADWLKSNPSTGIK